MEIKILCACGSKFKFDVEPVNGRAPADLSCPNCQASWTGQVNAIIAQQSGTASPPPPAPAVETPAAAMRPPATGRVRLRVAGHAPAAEPASPPAETAEATVATEPASLAAQSRTREIVKYDTQQEPADWGKFGLGATGAVIGALLGAVLYYTVYRMGFENKLMAVAVAVIAGLCARALGRKGSNELGLLTGAFTVGAIVLAQYFVARAVFVEEFADNVAGNYTAAVADAKETLKKIPNGTEREIREHLALLIFRDEDGNRVTPESVAAEDVEEFRDETLPMLRQLADGSMSQPEWEQAKGLTSGEDGELDVPQDATLTINGLFVLLAFSRTNLFCLIAAAGVGYKLTDF